jgi:hypothetical protein
MERWFISYRPGDAERVPPGAAGTQIVGDLLLNRVRDLRQRQDDAVAFISCWVFREVMQDLANHSTRLPR